jgi:hypothetical protein
MAMKGHQPGGGIASKQHVQTPVRTGSGSHNAHPAGAAQLGQAYGDHVTTRVGSTGYKGEPLHGPASRNFQPVPFGNEVALNVKGGGPGTGRTIYKTGTQDLHGSGGPQKPQGRPILSQYGPESTRPRNPES